MKGVLLGQEGSRYGAPDSMPQTLSMKWDKAKWCLLFSFHIYREQISIVYECDLVRTVVEVPSRITDNHLGLKGGEGLSQCPPSQPLDPRFTPASPPGRQSYVFPQRLQVFIFLKCKLPFFELFLLKACTTSIAQNELLSSDCMQCFLTNRTYCS